MKIFALCGTPIQDTPLIKDSSTRCNNVDIIEELMDLNCRKMNEANAYSSLLQNNSPLVNEDKNSNMRRVELSSCTSSHDLSILDENIRNIMANEKLEIHKDGVIQHDTIKFMFDCLYEQISYLKDGLVFLKAELASKNITIDSLLKELSYSRKTMELKTKLSESSRILNGLMGGAMNSTSIDEAQNCYTSLNMHSEPLNSTKSQVSDGNGEENLTLSANHSHPEGTKFMSISDQLNYIRKANHDKYMKYVENNSTNSTASVSEITQARSNSENISMERKEKGSSLDEVFAEPEWEKYSLGFGSRMLAKMGFKGRGLGKYEDGIVNPVTIAKHDGRVTLGASKSTYIKRGLEKITKAECNNTTVLPTTYRVDNPVKPWPSNTTLIIGSSLLHGIQESRLKKYNAKVRCHPGACVDDLYDYIAPLIKKKPSNIIMQIGSNDATFKTAEEILSEILNLKHYILKVLPGSKVYMSCPLLRTDDKKANSTLRQLDQELKCFNGVILNDNVDVTCLGKKGLHLNSKGSSRLAMNYISQMRRF